MESKNLAIGVLSVTAVILFVGLLIVNTRPQPAYASNVSASGGDYTLTVGRAAPDTELLYVIDNVTQRMVVYVINRATGGIEILDGMELGGLGAPPAAAGGTRSGY